MGIDVRPLDEGDLSEADRIYRLAFGTFLGLPDPMSFMGDADLVNTRWRAAPAAALGAYVDGTLVGSNFAANWGSFGFFGPLTVRPDLWNRGIARRLMTTTMQLFERWGTRQTGLFTFPDSPRHIGLYEKFGFRPRTLTPVLSKHVGRTTTATAFSTFSQLPEPARATCLAACRLITDAVYPGLDVGTEIMATAQQQLGDTLLIDDGRAPIGFAICHSGKGSEAGTGAAFVKFAAVRPGPGAAHAFDRLLSACETFADARGLVQLIAGVNAARQDAHRIVLRRDFRPFLEGVAMLRPDEPGYNRPDCFVIDDWR